MRELDRRRFLRALTVAGVVGTAPLTFPAAAQATRADATPRGLTPQGAAPRAVAPALRRFSLGDVDLADGVFTAKRDLILQYLRGYDVNRMLQVFRVTANLPTFDAVAPAGWDGLDGANNGNLRGHYTGHFLSAMSQAYLGGRDATLGSRIQQILGALTDCRAALRTAPGALSAPGPFGSSVDFVRGSYVYGELPAGLVDGRTTLTLTAWVHPTRAQNWARVLDIGTDTSRYLMLVARDGAGLPRFAITPDGPGREQVVTGPTALPLNRWSHLAITLGGGVGVLYVDGREVGRNTAMTTTPATLGSLAHSWLGRSHFGNDPLFAGRLAEVNVYGRALSAAEVGALRSATAGSTSTGRGDVASYALTESGTATLADSSGRGRPGALRRTWGGPSHPGFLAGYPETQFIELESMSTSDPSRVWAPYYTTHKILKGLLDAHAATGDNRAIDLASGLCDWMYSRLSRLDTATRQRMWSLWSSGEFGGVAEAILDVYAITRNADHLRLATLFNLESLITASAENRDILAGLHANQHIPIFVSLVRLYEETSETRYLDAARNFWAMVVPSRMYAHGGTSVGEFWQNPGLIASALSDYSAETCCAHNMLKLSRALFTHEPNPRYMEYYERTLINQILGSKSDTADAEIPRTTYYFALQPGAVRNYRPYSGTTCCEGTGIENATKYQDTVYLTAADGSALYVNLFTPSTLRWAARGITITQTTTFPVEQGTTVRIASGSGRFALRLRIPGWVRRGAGGPRVTVNGVRWTATVPVPGSYLVIDRAWASGDTVTLTLPFTLRTESTPDQPGTQAVFHGPLHLVARDSRTSLLPVSLYAGAGLSGDLIAASTPVSGRPLHRSIGGVVFAPLLEGTDDPFHAYVSRSEPRVVFGGRDSGVANRPRGTRPFLDEVWAAAPFSSKQAFVDRVSAVATTWQGAGVFTGTERDAVVSTAQAASMPT